MVTIIIPVYNVEKYLDKCLESVVNQTYKDIEIVLINDGSTDDSYKKCLEWENKDSRIVLVNKYNEGLGPTRNLGIHIAKSEYICFVDSDDWLHSTFVEKMYEKAFAEKADIVQCNLMQVDCNENETINDLRSFQTKYKMNINDRIAYGLPGIQLSMYRKKLWVDNKIKMPNIAYEDLATFGILLAYASVIVNIEEPLYYYRVGRVGSIIQTAQKDGKMILPALDHLINEFKVRNLFLQYEESLLRLSIRELGLQSSKCERINGNDLKIKNKYYFLNWLEEKFFDKWKQFDRQIVSFGSYNIMQVSNLLTLNRDFTENRYQFSSIISFMAPNIKCDVQFFHKNLYRIKMVEKDIKKEKFSTLVATEKRNIIIDFLEERFDILYIPDTFITESNAFVEGRINVEAIKNIERCSKECRKMWEDACLKFIELLRNKFIQIFLVKNFLAEKYKENEKFYEYTDKEMIKKINTELAYYYEYFEKNCKEAVIIDIEKKYSYTNKNHLFGCVSSHFNQFLEYTIAESISEKWKDNNGEKI